MRVILALIAASIVGCSQYAEQPPLITKGPNSKQVLVTFYDAKDQGDVLIQCAGLNAALTNSGACSLYRPGNPATLIIISVSPEDFNDQLRLTYWGHELGHGRGWVHGAP